MKTEVLDLQLETLEECEVLSEYAAGYVAGGAVVVVAAYAGGAILFT